MKTSIEFYIPAKNIDRFVKGQSVLYSPIAANGLIKIITSPNKIVFSKKVDSNLYYIRKATWKERQSLRRRRKL